ncbi:unnamed protein product, partial [Haemonchus placei]|uniref:PNPLA domain-containing protein n=1 Tax=Haemonchus placei TaxID=6290 RepID=A0A0N4XC22_HAEPC
ICELFDHVVGVSTGSIISSLLIGKGYSVEECREVYVDVSKKYDFTTIISLCRHYICELFDHVVGVSTGSIISSLLIGKGYSVEECREVYVDVSRKLFSQSRLTGVSGVVLNHSYYDTKKWMKILKEVIGEDLTIIETSKAVVPRLSIVAAIVNSPVLQPYIFRNYEAPAGRDSHYRGSTGQYLWKAIQVCGFYLKRVKLISWFHSSGFWLGKEEYVLSVFI